MQGIDFLNSKQTKLIYQFLEEQFGVTEKLPHAFYLRERDNKLHIIRREAADIDFHKLRVNSFGNYFGEWNTNHTQIRLSIEGSQFIGPLATKNIIKLTKKQYHEWLKGKDLEISTLNITDQSGYVLIQSHLDDFCGCGRIKDDKLLNFVPKVRRASVVVE